jgi:RNA polymerase sigma-70 factor (ECF subfamily)
MLVAEPKPEPLPVEKAIAGDPAAWDQLLQRYQLPLFSYVSEMVQDRQASLDIVQETFISAVRHLGSLRDPEKFGSWLFGIAHQKCVLRWRRHARENIALEEMADLPEVPGPEDPATVLIRKEREAEFFALLNRLPPPQRSTLLLFFLEQFSIEQIATITGTPEGTVKSRLHYAKAAFRKLFEEEQL